MNQKIQELLSRFESEQINAENFGEYQRWALSYFHCREKVINPNLHTTIQFCVTQAREVFEKNFRNSNESFTSYLTWRLMQAFAMHDEFNWRLLDGCWYRFKKNLLYVPIATQNQSRFSEIFFEDTANKTWLEFSQDYGVRVKGALTGQGQASTDACEALFHISVVIGNLPNLQFTSFLPHLHEMQTGRPVVYFGKRYKSGDELFMPMSIGYHHGNTDPFLVGKLLETYEKLLIQKD